YRGIQERLLRRPLELSSLLSQCLSPVPTRGRLPPSQPVPPSIAPALALGTDRNSARTSVQTRRSRPPNCPLYPIPSGYRLALSKPVPRRRPRRRQQLIQFSPSQPNSYSRFLRSCVQNPSLSCSDPELFL